MTSDANNTPKKAAADVQQSPAGVLSESQDQRSRTENKAQVVSHCCVQPAVTNYEVLRRIEKDTAVVSIADIRAIFNLIEQRSSSGISLRNTKTSRKHIQLHIHIYTDYDPGRVTL